MDPPSPRIPVALLGATGSVGQRFAHELDRHPWFELVAVAASPSSAGHRYRERVRWIQREPLPERLGELRLDECRPDLPGRLVFSALDADVAGEVETAVAASGRLVVSNASSHRLAPGVPLVVPEVNPEALDALAGRPPGSGAIVTNPNCTTIGLALALAPLARSFGLERVQVVSLQALSGAGLDGPTGYEVEGNVLPHIAGEERKVETELPRLLKGVRVSATCTRVPVVDGHTLCVSAGLGGEVAREDLISAWRAFRGAPQELELPSAPRRPTAYLDDPDGPQPRLHADLERGMACVVGRLRPCPLLGWKFVAVTHNTLRGAALGSILLAELAVARGLVPPE